LDEDGAIETVKEFDAIVVACPEKDRKEIAALQSYVSDQMLVWQYRLKKILNQQ
jgi:hypothetical protein